MAIAKVQDVGAAMLNNAASATSHVVPALANSVSVGNFIAVWVAAAIAAGGNPVQSTLADGLGNTYTQIGSVSNAGTLALWVCYAATTAGAPTYTLTCTANYNYLLVSASEWSGLGASLDQTTSHTGAGTTALDTGTTGATTTPNELILAGFGIHGTSTLTSTTTPTGYSVLGHINSTTIVYHIFPFSLIVSATGTQDATSTLSATPTGSFNLIATFPAAAGPVVGSTIVRQAVKRAASW